MQIAILSFDGFNELDSFVALSLLNRVPGWHAMICAPDATVTSMNGVMISAGMRLDTLPDMDAVIVGSGVRTRQIAADEAVMARLRLDPLRQLIGAQCSGALLLATLGLLETVPVCTDATSRPWVEAAGVRVIEAPFHASANIATAGGCMAAHYLAAWMIARGAGEAQARTVIDYVAPVGEKEATVERIMSVVSPFLRA
ncbi:DJ-1/PfpI family protein [Sphingobium abikonense]|uniref:DJ-1/PfpI family protein n=1 Tax=Sphingobium abikonense TaxID=86193 RepID=UPI00351631F9